MLIEEHLRGIIYIPVHDGDSYTVIEHAFTEDDVIQGSCSITSRCCDDSTFSIGGVRPAELAIKLRIELPEVNAYTLYGAKIRLYSIYSSAENAEETLRGEFWVTSAKRTRSIYTLKASDAIVWLDSGAYDISSAGNTQTETDNPIYQYCVNAIRTIEANFTYGIMAYVNNQLAACEIEPIAFDVRKDITNNFPDEFSFALLPAEISGSCGSRSPRDYAAYLAQLAAGCVQMIPCPDEPEVCKLYLTPYGYQPTGDCSDAFRAIWADPVTITYDTIALEGCDIADYELYVQKTYIKTYDETGWSSGSEYRKYCGNVVIDLSGNPFLDGRWYHGHDINGVQKNPFSVLSGIGEQLAKCAKRPFALKCHPQFARLANYPKLGQRIRIEEQPREWKESIITKMIWTFRGGWTFGCAGSDSRVLSQAAKQSLAKHAENAAKTHANILMNTASASVAAVSETADAAMAQANQTVIDLRNTINIYDSNFQGVWDRLAALEAKE